jgi:hypothetical protein
LVVLGCPTRALAQEVYPAGLAWLKKELVVQVDLGHDGFNLVVAVRSLAGYEQTKVNLGWGAN